MKLFRGLDGRNTMTYFQLHIVENSIDPQAIVSDVRPLESFGDDGINKR